MGWHWWCLGRRAPWIQNVAQPSSWTSILARRRRPVAAILVKMRRPLQHGRMEAVHLVLQPPQFHCKVVRTDSLRFSATHRVLRRSASQLVRGLGGRKADRCARRWELGRWKGCSMVRLMFGSMRAEEAGLSRRYNDGAGSKATAMRDPKSGFDANRCSWRWGRLRSRQIRARRCFGNGLGEGWCRGLDVRRIRSGRRVQRWNAGSNRQNPRSGNPLASRSQAPPAMKISGRRFGDVGGSREDGEGYDGDVVRWSLLSG